MALAHKMPAIALDGPDLHGEVDEAAPEAKIIAIVGGAAAPIDSPALALQGRIENAYSTGAEVDGKWSARRSIAFAVGASLGLWTLIGLAVRALLH